MQERRVIKAFLLVLMAIFIFVSLFDRVLVSWKFVFGAHSRDWVSYSWDFDNDEYSTERDWNEDGFVI